MNCKGTLRQVSEAQNPIPPLPNMYTVYVYTYTYSHRERREGGVLNQREGESTHYKAGLTVTT
jgi:hypothetical protein